MDKTSEAIRTVFRVSRGRYRGHRPILVKQPREALGEVYKQAGFRFGAEIGVKRGDYSAAILECLPTLTYTCVDIWDSVPDQYMKRRARYLAQAKARLAQYPGVIFVKKSSLPAALDVSDGALDFVYIDAAHDFDNVVQDLIQWSAKVRPGGIVALHDYYQHRYGGVVPAVDAYIRCHQIDPWYVTYEIMPTVFWVKP